MERKSWRAFRRKERSFASATLLFTPDTGSARSLLASYLQNRAQEVYDAETCARLDAYLRERVPAIRRFLRRISPRSRAPSSRSRAGCPLLSTNCAAGNVPASCEKLETRQSGTLLLGWSDEWICSLSRENVPRKGCSEVWRLLSEGDGRKNRNRFLGDRHQTIFRKTRWWV